MLIRSFFILLFISANTLYAQQATTENIQRYTQEWMISKFHKATVGDKIEVPAVSNQNRKPTLISGKSLEEITVSNEEGPESEVTAVMSPQDTNKIVAAVMKTGVPLFLNDPTIIQIYFSHDFGATWIKSAFQSDDVFDPENIKKGGGDPVLTYDKDGTLHLTWIVRLATSLFNDPRDVTRIHHATSTDDGISWEIAELPIAESEAIAVIDAEGVRLEGIVLDKDWLIADNNPASPHYGNLYLFYTEIEAPGPNGVGYRIRGNTWNAQDGWSEAYTVITTADLPFAHFPSPTIAPDGKIYLMVAGATLIDEFTAFYLVVSTDGGQSYSFPKIISYWDLPCFLQLTDVPSCVEGIPAMRSMPSGSLHHNPTNDELYAIWYADGFLEPNQPREGTDIYFTVSKDQGTSWSNPKAINTDSLFTTDSYIPTGIIDENGYFYVTWYDNRATDGGTDYYGIRYDPTREAFSDEFVITTSRTDFSTVGARNGGFGVGEYNTTLTTNSTLLPIWADGRSNDGDLNIRIAKIDKSLTISGENICVVTSTNSLRNDGLQMTLSPNPVTGPLLLTIDLPSAATRVKAEIIDSQGRLIRELMLPERLTSGEHRFEIPTNGLTSATYFVSVVSAERGRTSLAFIKR